MDFFKGKKKNWVIVLHKHHTDSEGFKHELLIEASEKEAKAYAMIKAEEWKGCDISRVTGMAIELPNVVQVVKQEI